MSEYEPSKELAPSSRSIVQIKVGSKEYDMVRSNRCGVCMHPGRFHIESRLMENYGYPAIVRFVSEQTVTNDDGTTTEWPKLTVTQIKHHREQGHVPINSEMIRELSARRAEALGFDFETSTGQLVDHAIASKMILQTGISNLVNGTMEIGAKDVLAAAKLEAMLEANSQSNADIDQYKNLIMTFFDVVRKEVEPDQFQSIMKVLSSNPIVQEFRTKQAAEGNKLS